LAFACDRDRQFPLDKGDAIPYTPPLPAVSKNGDGASVRLPGNGRLEELYAMNLIETLEKEEIARVSGGKALPTFEPGDTLRVNVKIKEGERERVQAYEGVCIARSGGGLNANFTVRKISFGEGVERVFPLFSPSLDSIDVVRRGKVRRGKLYYLRDRRGKSARIAERTSTRQSEG
jgi:large subunit ribosomal protein L19